MNTCPATGELGFSLASGCFGMADLAGYSGETTGGLHNIVIIHTSLFYVDFFAVGRYATILSMPLYEISLQDRAHTF